MTVFYGARGQTRNKSRQGLTPSPGGARRRPCPETDALGEAAPPGLGSAAMEELAILIVDDDADVRLAAKLALEPRAARVETLDNPETMTARLAQSRFD